jgi:hypothetical protein
MRLTGPGMSLSASGTFGKTITFSIWKGQAYGRLRVIPINRNSVGQQTVRSVLGTIAKAVRAVLTLANDTPVTGTGSQFFIDAVAVAPAGQSWLSYLQKVSNSEFAGNVSEYGALDGTHKGYWNDSATDIGMGSYIDKAGVTHTAGEQLYLLAKYAVGYLGYTSFATTPAEAVAVETDAFGVYVNTSAA